MTKHFMLSALSTLSLASISAIHAVGLLPDTTTPVHLLVDTSTAKSLEMLPITKAKKFNPAVIANISNSTQGIGIKFTTAPDLKQLFDSELIGELKSAAESDTAVYVGTMPMLTGGDGIDDDKLVVLAIGPQAKSMITAFAGLGDHQNIDNPAVKQFFIGLATDNDKTMKPGKSATTGTQPARELAEA